MNDDKFVLRMAIKVCERSVFLGDSWHLHVGVDNAFRSFELVVASGKGPDDILDKVGFGVGQLLGQPDDNFIASHAVVMLIVDLFVFMGVQIPFVLEVPVLGADSYCDCFVVDAVLDHCAEEFVA
jgi:hypothetical protein